MIFVIEVNFLIGAGGAGRHVNLPPAEQLKVMLSDKILINLSSLLAPPILLPPSRGQSRLPSPAGQPPNVLPGTTPLHANQPLHY